MKTLILVILSLISLSVIADDKDHETLAIGLGVGIPYGGLLGTKLEYRPIKELSLSAGLGTVIASKGYSYGAIFNMYKIGSFEPRLSYYYGTNGILFNPNTKESETFEGNNIGLGFQTSNGYRAWSFDLIYILSSGLQDRIKEINNNNNFEISKPTSKTRIAIGYHWLF